MSLRSLLLVGSVILTIVFSCKKNKNDSIVTIKITTSIHIEFYNPAPLEIDLNSYKPSLKGKIPSDYAINSYTVYLFNQGNKTKVSEKNFDSELTEYKFSIDLSCQLASDSASVEVTNPQYEMKNIKIVKIIKNLA